MNTPTSPGALIEAATIRYRKAGENVATKVARGMELSADVERATADIDLAMKEQAEAKQGLQDAIQSKYLPPVLQNDDVGDAELDIDAARRTAATTNGAGAEA